MKSRCIYRVLLLCMFITRPQLCNSQTTFYNTYGHVTDGGEGRNVAQAKDGGYFLTYYIYYASKWITCLTKLNCAGVKEWDKKFDCGYTTLPVELIPQKDNGCILTLSTRKTADWEATVMRLDANGDQVWTTSAKMHIAGMVGSSDQAKDGSIYVCGSVVAAASGTNGTALAKINSAGQLLWLKHYYDYAHHTPIDLTVTSENKITIIGTAGFSGQSFTNLFVMLCDKDGNFLKRKVVGTYYDDEPKAICSDKAGNIYVTGYSYFLNSEWDPMFLKMNNKLDIVQSKFYDASTPQGEQARCILHTANNGIAIFGDEGGFNERNPMLINLDTSGTLQWAKSYPVSPLYTNYCFQGAQCSDGGFLWTGDVRPPSQYRNAPIIKTKADGDAGCFTSSLTLTERNEIFTELDTSVLVTIINDTAGHKLIPLVVLPTSETVFCSYVLPCGDFTKTAEVCPQVCYDFNDHSINATSWLWTFEAGTPASSNDQFPSQVCYTESGLHKVSLQLSNSNGTATYVQYVSGTPDCPVIVPNIFSPNNDGLNETFFALEVKGEFSLQIFNRWGKEIFSSEYPGVWWNGSTNEGIKVADGTYFYVLRLKESGKIVHGTVELVK